MENLFSMEKLFHGNYLNRYFQYINWIHYLLKIKITFFSLFFHALLLGSEQISIDGDVEIVSDFSSRTCPDVVDSCIYICSDGDTNPCHPSEIITISVDTIPGIEDSDGSRYRIYFPWEHGGMNASKFRVTASWPCLSPTLVAAAGDYAFWDVIGNDACPGTVEGSIWYGDDCQDESGNIGSEDCIELIGRFCFAPGDTLDWPDESDQSIANDYCDACWMSAPAWGQYDTYEYSDSLLSPGSCSAFDHCHHSTSDNILCGVGYLDDNFVSVKKDNSGEIVSYAKAQLEVDGHKILCEGQGNGPVNALDNAIRKNVNKLAKYSEYLKDLRLVDYKVRILNTGTEAVTRVSIESTDSKGINWFTIGVSPNIIDASFKALIDSLDYKLYKDKAPGSS